MRSITKKDKIKNIVDIWKEFSKNEDSSILNELISLDKNEASEADITRIIGSSYWTRIWCDVCHTSNLEKVIELKIKNEIINICPKCINKAADLTIPNYQ